MTTSGREDRLRLAIPSDGELHEPTLRFLGACGVPVERSSARRYTAHLGGVPGVLVLFQRTTDIALKVEEGTADLGIVGLDRFLEVHREGGPAAVLLHDLGYGRCDLVVAVPDAWVDVTSTADLADLAWEFRERGRTLRIATKYPRLAQQFLIQRGVTYFTIVPSSGTLEVAPVVGFADLIVDISSSGTTLRENRLKPLSDGVILSSQACLIGNLVRLKEDPQRLALARVLLERMEAHLRAQEYYQVTANLQGESAEAVAAHVLRRREVAGVQGPTIAPVFSADGRGWYAVTVLVPKQSLLEAVEHLRRMGGNGITVVQSAYFFQETCQAYQRLLQALEAL
ncbi:MAG: ATP phosphoribosyltransferase [Dehalococcoidia bacterium]|nr:ATP phosphoribosyltransferase [Dehalococcoidia bacterium]MDW8119613.1 ATP phosphoribosyltransferase [Chloroflexota bacterium]